MADNTDAQDDAPAPGGKKWLIPVVALTIGVLGSLVVTRVPFFQEALGLVPAAAVADVEDAPIEYGVFAELDPIVINPRGSNGRRFLMVKVGVEAEEQKTLDRLGELMPATVDQVIEIFGELDVAELTDVTRRDSLKTSVQATIDEVLGDDGPVNRIYFTQYVLQ